MAPGVDRIFVEPGAGVVGHLRAAGILVVMVGMALIAFIAEIGLAVRHTFFLTPGASEAVPGGLPSEMTTPNYIAYQYGLTGPHLEGRNISYLPQLR